MLAALVAPGAAATPASDEPPPHAATVDEMVEQLRADPVLVQPSMGMGDTRLAHEVLSQAVADAGVPVYVVLAEMPEELARMERPAEQVAVLFREALGDGIYHVDFLEGSSYTGAWGVPDELDFRPAYIALRAAEQRASGEYPRPSALFEAVLVVQAAVTPGAELPSSVVDEYASQPWAFLPERLKPIADARADRWVATLIVVTGVLVAGLIITAGIARAKPLARGRSAARPPAYEAVPDGLDRRVHKRLGGVRRRRDALSGDELTSPAGERATSAIEAAERVIDTGDELDLVGADVLTRIADREIDRLHDPERRRYQPCFINPLHGEASDTVRLDGSSIDAPVCSACGRRQGAFLSTRKRMRGWEPYVDTSTVWARTGYGALVGDLTEQVLADRSVRR